MNPGWNIKRRVIIAVLLIFLLAPVLPGLAQAPLVITATGTMTRKDADVMQLTMTFPPEGGKVSGTATWSGYSTGNAICPSSMDISLEGTYAGGDGGTVTGTSSGTAALECPKGTNYFSIDGSWSGNFFANGTGYGVMDMTAGQGASQLIWQVTFSSTDFATAFQVKVTPKTILTKYNIRVEDSPGDGVYAASAWSDHELSLLNVVLQQIPPDLLKNMALSSIVRNKVEVNEFGEVPTTVGMYYRWGLNGDDKTGSSAVIRIFDRAFKPFDFSFDPNGDVEFKGSLLHEMIHALQSRRDQNSVYTSMTESPLVQDFMDATRSDATSGSGSASNWYNNGWAWYPNQQRWIYHGSQDNQPPTRYGTTSPWEDMSESVMMYVYDPQRLMTSSMPRYEFIRDHIYQGIEYENGIQKKP